MNAVNIWDGAVIGAGSIVNRYIPAGEIGPGIRPASSAKYENEGIHYKILYWF